MQRRRSWCLSTDPEFTRQAADIVGLYLHPPENAVVLSLDEKPHMQALERAQGWLRQHPHVHLHFTSTHASWLNQVEVRFSLRARQALRGASFTRVRQLREAMDAFIAVYNPQAAPFEWTKREVRSVEPKYKYAYLRN